MSTAKMLLRLGQIEAQLKALNAERAELWRALGRKSRLNWEQAERRALHVRELRSEGLTQRAIAEKLAMGRDMVAHYLAPGNKALQRAQAKQAARSAA